MSRAAVHGARRFICKSLRLVLERGFAQAADAIACDRTSMLSGSALELASSSDMGVQAAGSLVLVMPNPGIAPAAFVPCMTLRGRENVWPRQQRGCAGQQAEMN